MLSSHNSGLATQNSQLTTRAVDVLFHPTARSSAGACPLHPPTEAQMDAAGISCALVSPCKKWLCERQWMCVDTRLEDVLRYTASSPRFIGLAGYNPFDIAESLREIELGVGGLGFRGAYVHAASFNLPLADPHMYPLFAKAAELAVPVLVQFSVGSDLGRDLGRVTADFPDLSLVLAHPCPPLSQVEHVAAQCENVFFALDAAALAHFQRAWTARTADHEAALVDGEQRKPEFLSGVFQQRCMWGSNAVDWCDALRIAGSLPLPAEIKDRFFRLNAERVFALGQPLASRQPHSAVTEILAAER